MAQPDKAFEVFVKRAVGNIQKEAWGRGKDAKDLRDACTTFLSALEQHENGTEAFEGSLAVAVLQPLSLACSNSNAKVVELALGCLHKLVAHAWLQGESSVFEGLMDDGSDVVAQVIKIVVKCGESPGEALQLAVIRALLTFSTAEHFVAHGDCLMSAVRTVFNLALGSEAEIIKRTAANALLQMLNTITKRITSYQLHSYSSISPTGSTRASEQGSGLMTEQHIRTNPVPSHSTPPHMFQKTSFAKRSTSSSVAAHAVVAAAAMLQSEEGHADGLLMRPPHVEEPVASTFQRKTSISHVASGELQAADAMAAGSSELSSDTRIAQFASLAEQRDLRGLEAAIGDSSNTEEQQEQQMVEAPTGLTSGAASAVAAAASSSISQANSSKSSGLQVSISSHLGSPGTMSPLASPGALRAMQQQQAQAAVMSLTIMERDVLQVLTAFCKLASRESGLTEVESFLHQGKLLALELLVKVLQNPQHTWGCVRDEFARHLRQPICITLLRNCSATDAAAFQLAIKLLVAVMSKLKLRRVLKAELGAFYPLFILRPLETGRQDLPTLYAVLSSLKAVCTEPQLLVEVFVNYDCDLQAPCLFERTVAALSSLSRLNEAELDRPQQVGKIAEQAARVAAVKDAALRALLAVVGCLEAWAAPIKESHARNVAATSDEGSTGAGGVRRDETAGVEDSDGGVGESSGSHLSVVLEASSGIRGMNGALGNEADHFEAAHSRKAALAKGIAHFNTNPVKGVRYLLKEGLIPGGPSSQDNSQDPSSRTPADVAAFLHLNRTELDKSSIGEYFGHHEDFSVAVMHEWIDLQPSMSGVHIDQALRQMLDQFRLPGEAQKIDRIMEKFAERYVRDNPGRFSSADGAYVLAFAIIMLNTDAHNPLAERRLGKADFVAMNSQPASSSSTTQTGQQVGADSSAAAASSAQSVISYELVLPAEELEAIYDRIVKNEIKMQEDGGRGSAIITSGGGAPSGGAAFAGAVRNSLASALGLRALAAPFKPISRGWGRQQQGLSEADRKRKLVELAERTVMSASSGHRSVGQWHSTNHAEHARPMLTVSSGPLLEALTYSLALMGSTTGTGGTAGPAAVLQPILVSALVAVVEMSALLGLEELCETCVGALFKASGVSNPAAYGSSEEAKQLACLKALLSLAAGPVAGLLGSGWTMLLEAAAALDALASELAGGSQPVSLLTDTALDEASLANPLNKMFQALGVLNLVGTAGGMGAGSTGGAAGGHNALIPVPPRPKTASSAAVQAEGSEGNGVGSDTNGSSISNKHGYEGPARFTQGASPSVLKPLHGAGLVLWGLSEGYDVVEKVYSSSTSLDGEAVIVFFRALCAVSREELDSSSNSASGGSGGARLYSLQRLLDCAAANSGRIRLIRSKLWSVTGSHLVMVACHPAPSVATYAVNALYGLAQHLLSRAELARFTQQEEAVRPFVSVLRVCDDPEVRRLTVKSAVGSCAPFSSSLGTGWKTLLEVLRRAAADADPNVVSEALGPLKATVEALFRNTPAFSNKGMTRQSSSGGGAGPASPTFSKASSRPLAFSALEGSHNYFNETLAAVMAAAMNSKQAPKVGLTAASLLQECGQRLADHSSHPSGHTSELRGQSGGGDEPGLQTSNSIHDHCVHQHPPLPTTASSIPQLTPAAEKKVHWAALLSQLADWAGSEPRPQVADAAAQVTLSLMSLHGCAWGEAAWGILLKRVLPKMLRPPAVFDAQLGGAIQEVAAASEQALSSFISRASDAFNGLCSQLGGVPQSVKTELMLRLSTTCLEWMSQEEERVACLGLDCFENLSMRLAKQQDIANWKVLLGHVVSLVKEGLQSIVKKEVCSARAKAAESAPAFTNNSSVRSIGSKASSDQHPLDIAAASSLLMVGGAKTSSDPSVPSVVDAKARMVLMLQRKLLRLHAECMAGVMPWTVQACLATMLMSNARDLMDFNDLTQKQRLSSSVSTAVAGVTPLIFNSSLCSITLSEQMGSSNTTDKTLQLLKQADSVNTGADSSEGSAAVGFGSMIAGSQASVGHMGNSRLSSQAVSDSDVQQQQPGSDSSHDLRRKVLEGCSSGMSHLSPSNGNRAGNLYSDSMQNPSSTVFSPDANGGNEVMVSGGQEEAFDPASAEGSSQSKSHQVLDGGAATASEESSAYFVINASKAQLLEAYSVTDEASPFETSLPLEGLAFSEPAAAAAAAARHSRYSEAVLTSEASQDEPAGLLLGRLEAETLAGAMMVLGQYALMEMEDGGFKTTTNETSSSYAEDPTASGLFEIPDLAEAVSLGPGKLLRSFCLFQIQRASESLSEHQQSACLPASVAPKPLEPWFCTLRASNLAHAIRVFLELCSTSLPEAAAVTAGNNKELISGRSNNLVAVGVALLWPHLVTLVCCPHAVVRNAVADYLCANVATLILPAMSVHFMA